MKRFFALLLCAILLLTMFPVSAVAAKSEPADVWEQIAAIEDRAAATRGASTLESRAAAYTEVLEEIVAAVEASPSYVEDSLIRSGNFIFWMSDNGDPCGYAPHLSAKLKENAIPGADPDELAAVETVSYAPKGGYPTSTSVTCFQPFRGIDGSFTAQYENRCNNLAQALGGTGTTYKASAATIDQIGQAISNSAVVIFDSHGDTNYEGYGGDYTSQADTSYLLLTTGTGITAEDKASAQGPYHTYYHAFNSGGYWFVDGTAISNHMTTDSPNGLLWMAICLGMATDGMHAPIRAKGVEVVYGYSQSVTFAGDYAWEAKFWPKMVDGAYVKDAIAYMKQQIGCPDPYTSQYPAYPIVVSSEDVYPGHGNVDANQTVYSTWTLFTQFEINAVPNNPAWGSVSVSATKITAIPAYGYYVDGYEVLEGQATVTQNGNVFNVEPQSDCTIQINFAPRDPAVVHFSVPEGVSCTEINAYVGDYVTLPEPTGEPTVEGRTFRFLGWVTAPMAEDSLDIPEYLAPGAEIKITETDMTYYALYSYFVAVEGLEIDQFPELTEEPHFWAGEYVITYDGAYALGATTSYLGSNATNRLGVKKSVVDLAAAGLTYENAILTGVTDEITYVIEPVGNGSYTVKMKSVNHYLAMASDKDSLTTYTSSNSDKTRWTLSWGANGPVFTSVQYPGRSIQFDAAGKVFQAVTGAKEPLTLFKKAEGDTWYTTDPREKVVCEEHVFGDWTVTEEPSCTESGLQKRFCTVCGYTETETLEALGHDYAAAVTEPTCTEGGYTTYTCSRCGDTYAADETQPLGHAWDEGVVTTEPTEETPGVKTFTCTRCGATREEEIPATGHVCACAHFEDMPEFGTPEHEAIEWAYLNGYTEGVDETHFGVGKSLTRAETATFFWTVSGKPEISEDMFENPFSDVKSGKWYTKYVLWAYSEGLVSGYEDGTYRPNNELNRGEILTLLYAWADKPSVEGVENPYSDVAPGKWYEAPALWAYSEGIERGEDGVFARNTLVTRETFVLYLYRHMTGNCLAD